APSRRTSTPRTRACASTVAHRSAVWPMRSAETLSGTSPTCCRTWRSVARLTSGTFHLGCSAASNGTSSWWWAVTDATKSLAHPSGLSMRTWVAGPRSTATSASASAPTTTSVTTAGPARQSTCATAVPRGAAARSIPAVITGSACHRGRLARAPSTPEIERCDRDRTVRRPVPGHGAEPSGPPLRTGCSPAGLGRALAQVGDREARTALLGGLVRDDARQREAGRRPGVDRRLGARRHRAHEVVGEEVVRALVAVVGAVELLRQPAAVVDLRQPGAEALHEGGVDVAEALGHLAGMGVEEVADVERVALGVVLALGLDAQRRAVAGLLHDRLGAVEPEPRLVALPVAD